MCSINMALFNKADQRALFLSARYHDIVILDISGLAVNHHLILTLSKKEVTLSANFASILLVPCSGDCILKTCLRVEQDETK